MIAYIDMPHKSLRTYILHENSFLKHAHSTNNFSAIGLSTTKV